MNVYKCEKNVKFDVKAVSRTLLRALGVHSTSPASFTSSSSSSFASSSSASTLASISTNSSSSPSTFTSTAPSTSSVTLSALKLFGALLALRPEDFLLLLSEGELKDIRRRFSELIITKEIEGNSVSNDNGQVKVLAQQLFDTVVSKF